MGKAADQVGVGTARPHNLPPARPSALRDCRPAMSPLCPTCRPGALTPLRNWCAVPVRYHWGARPPRALFSAPTRKTSCIPNRPPPAPEFGRPNCWTRGLVPRRPRGARPPRAQRRTPPSAATSASARACIRSFFPEHRPPLRGLEALKAFDGQICCQRTRAKISSSAKKTIVIWVV